jgi:hypothetical protein
MIERASDRFVALPCGKVTPLPTGRGKLLPLDSDSSFKRIAYVITSHSLCRHRRSSRGEYSPSRSRAQKGFAAGSYRRLLEQHRRSSSGRIHAESFRQPVQFAAADHRRPSRVCGYEPGCIDHQRGGFIRCGWICGRCGQDKRHGLILKSRIAASGCGLVTSPYALSQCNRMVRIRRCEAGERAQARRLKMPRWRPNIGRRTDCPRPRTPYALRPSWVP